MAEHCDALIIGAGPAGSATALRLATLGHRVTLVDKHAFPRDKCCSEYASPETLRELDALGVLGVLDAQGWTALQGTSVRGAGGAQLYGRFDDAGVVPYRPTGMPLPRRELDLAMLRAAASAGATVHERTRLKTLDRHHDGTMHATLEHPDGPCEVVARVVIGADGLGSRVARLKGLRRQGGLQRMAFVAHLSGVSGLQSRAELHVGRRGYVGLNPIAAERTNVAVVVRANDAAAARGDATGFFWQALAHYPQLAGRVATAQVVREVLVTGPFNVGSRSCTTNGVALVGDAADFFDPFTGEGMWTALVGARLLSGALHPLLLGSEPVGHRALAPYRRARRRQFAGKWIVERTIGHAMRWPALFNGAVRRIERAGLAGMMIGISGDFVPAVRMLSPRVLWRLATANSERRTENSEQRAANCERRTAEVFSRLTTNDSRLHG